MQKFVRLVGAVALTGLGVWLWIVFFPSPEKAIRLRLKALAQTASFDRGDGMVAKAYSAQKAAGYFTTNSEVDVDLRGYQQFNFNGRDEILQAVLAGARTWRGFKVEFLDINVTLEPGQQSAKANLTGKWSVPGDREFNAQEFNFFLRKENGQWLIYRVETVKTLSQILLRAA